jgi:hypothetical protein
LTRSAANALDADFKTAMNMAISIVPNNNTKNVVFEIKNEIKLKTQDRRDFEIAFRETLDLVDSGIGLSESSMGAWMQERRNRSQDAH